MADASIVSLTWPEADVAVLTINDSEKGANVLSSRVLDELQQHLDALADLKDLAGIILISGKPGNFVAGADLREFVAWIDADKQQVQDFSQRGQQLFARLSTLPAVSIAAIDGACLGGGAELAVWCDRRILSDNPKTQIGFPEVKLGLFPGWGGTARTPRIVGLSNAVELISSGDAIDAESARKMGLADDVVSVDRLLPAAIEMVRADQSSGEFRDNRRRWQQPLPIDETELGFLGATASAYIRQQTKGHYPAPEAALEVMLSTAGVDVQSACQMESEQFVELFGSPVNRALLNVFFLQDRNKKDRGVDNPQVKPQPVKTVGVVGAGIMGQGIAAANVKRRVPVTISDAHPEALAAGVQKILQEVSYDKKIKGPDVKRAIEMAPLINGTMSDEELAATDLVVEAIVENLDVKKKLFARLELKLTPDAILASNTSTIPITKMAAELAYPERFCGIHFFNPVRKMPLVEVIRGERTSDQTVATAVGYAKSLGKSPIVVGDGPGFLVNRVLLPYMNEALELVLDGASIDQVEKTAKGFGMPMGPITLFDVVGLDTALHAGRVMYEAFPDRIVPSQLLTVMYKKGRLGQKSGAGFFKYEGGSSRGKPDPEVDEIIQQRRRGEQRFTQDELTARLFLPMLLEATRILQEDLVRDPRDVDLALIYGIGFPPFRGGLLFWADTLGAAKIIEMLEPLAGLGKRFEPTEMLQAMAAENKTFYPSGASA